MKHKKILIYSFIFTIFTLFLFVSFKNNLQYKDDEISLIDSYDRLSSMDMKCEMDYFIVSPLETPNKDEAVKVIEPSIIFFKKTSGIKASAFIYNVTPDYVYFICAAHSHLSSSDGKFETIKLSNGTEKDGVSFIVVDTNSTADATTFKIPTSEFNSEDLRYIKQANLNDNNIVVGSQVILHTKYWNFNTCLSRSSTIKNIYEDCLNGQSTPTLIIETSGIASGGQSGSPLIDYYGNVVGVCSRGDSSISHFSKICEVQNRLQLYE